MEENKAGGKIAVLTWRRSYPGYCIRRFPYTPTPSVTALVQNCGCGDESNESDVATKAASLLSRGAAADCSPGRQGVLLQLQFQMVCERPPRSLRSRLPLTGETGFIFPLREGESRRRRQGSLTHHRELELGSVLRQSPGGAKESDIICRTAGAHASHYREPGAGARGLHSAAVPWL